MLKEYILIYIPNKNNDFFDFFISYDKNYQNNDDLGKYFKKFEPNTIDIELFLTEIDNDYLFKLNNKVKEYGFFYYLKYNKKTIKEDIKNLLTIKDII